MSENLIKRVKHKPCGQIIYWRQKSDGTFDPPFDDAECTIRHHCIESESKFSEKKVREIPMPEGVEAMKKTCFFLVNEKTKKKLKAKFFSQDLNINDWDDFWSSLQDARTIMKKSIELLSEDED